MFFKTVWQSLGQSAETIKGKRLFNIQKVYGPHQKSNNNNPNI